MARHVWAVLPLVLAVGCSADPDEDGLESSEERDLGTDPKLADSDDDGVTDGAEVEAGLDPLAADSDDDGLVDGDELLYGFDPLDPKSDGYRGNWPMQTVSIKDEVADVGKRGQGVEIGRRFPRWRTVDQFRDEVDLYDFARQGKRVVVDVSAEWCSPCKTLASFLDGQVTPEELRFPAADAEVMNEILRQIRAGELYWVTVMAEDVGRDSSTGGYLPPTVKTSRRWHDAFPTKGIPILADTKQASIDYVVRAHAGAFPTLVALDEEMHVIDVQAGFVESDGSVDFYRTLIED